MSRRVTSGVSADQPLPREWPDRVGVSAPNLLEVLDPPFGTCAPPDLSVSPSHAVRFDESIF